jgi:hypothetical protein
MSNQYNQYQNYGKPPGRSYNSSNDKYLGRKRREFEAGSTGRDSREGGKDRGYDNKYERSNERHPPPNDRNERYENLNQSINYFIISILLFY